MEDGKVDSPDKREIELSGRGMEGAHVPPPSCVLLFNAVCNTFNVPSFPPRRPLLCPLCIHPSCNFRGGREGVSPPCSWRHACLHCLRETHASSRIRCPLRMTMHLFFSSIFFFFVLFFASFPPSLFFMQIFRAFVFLFLVPLPLSSSSSSPHVGK